MAKQELKYQRFGAPASSTNLMAMDGMEVDTDKHLGELHIQFRKERNGYTGSAVPEKMAKTLNSIEAHPGHNFFNKELKYTSKFRMTRGYVR